VGAWPAATRDVPRLDSRLRLAEHWGALRMRLGIGRDRYRVDPGLYALGEPGPEAPVLVSANYKLSLDHLRAALPGRSAWILVLDTEGVNVWCAAGHGSFGTEELLRRIDREDLAGQVKTRRLILPQLGAPGVDARRVREESGLRAVWGPVMAADLPAFLDAGCKATPAMRRKRFPLGERAALVPLEFRHALRWALLLGLALAALNALGWGLPYRAALEAHGALAAGALLVGLLAGTVATPLLLPWLPGRAFSLKGLAAGLLCLVPPVAYLWPMAATAGARVELAGWGLVAVAWASFLGLQFTGCSTYTSLSGVRVEMRRFLPLQIAAAALGLALALFARWVPGA